MGTSLNSLLGGLYTGPQGATGATGIGATGATGNVGATGATGPIAGSNTQVIFNDDGTANGNASLTFNKTTGALSATLLAGTLTTTAQPNITSVGTLGNLTVTSNITAGNFVGRFANGTSNISIPAAGGNINISAGGGNIELVITSTGINVTGTLNATGNANTGNIGATNGVFTNVSGNGAALSSITGANVTGTVPSATTAGTVTTAAQPNITSVGTLSSLLVTGTANLGNVSNVKILGGSNAQVLTTDGTGNLSWTTPTGGSGTPGGANTQIQYNNNGSFAGSAAFTFDNTSNTITSNGNIISSNVYANTGTIAASLLGGTLTTASQPNITSVGTLSSLTVTGNVTAGNFVGTLANGNSNISIPTASGNINLSAAGGTTELVITSTGVNVTGTLNATGNANVGNVGATNGVFTNVSGNGAALTSITGANVTGTVSSATTAGTVTTAAQPNITSIGTLSSLTITGTATAGNVYANSGTIGASLLTGTLTTAAQPNVTSVGTLTSLTVTGNVTAGNVTGANLVSANFVTGTLTTAAQPNITSVGTLSSLTVTGNITAGNLLGVFANGNSNIAIPAAGGNINLSAGGTPNELVITSTGVNIAGTLNATGNANVGNIGATNANITAMTASGNVTANYFIGNGSLLTGISTGGGSPWALKTANYTASNNDRILADTGAGSFTITLPSSPAQGVNILIADVNNWAANSLILARNGSTIENLSADLALDVQGALVELVYDGNTWETYPTVGTGTNNIVSLSSTQTLTNKRINPRVNNNGATTSGTVTPTGDSSDQYEILGLTGNITLAAPSGTPVAGQKLMLRLKDDGNSRGITWTTTSGAYRAIGVDLPAATTANKVTYAGCIYNSTDVFWDVVAVTTQT